MNIIAREEYREILEDIKSDRLLIAQAFDDDRPILFPTEDDVYSLINRVRNGENFDYRQFYTTVDEMKPFGTGVSGSVYDIDLLDRDGKIYSLMQHMDDDIIVKYAELTDDEEESIVNEIVNASRMTALVNAQILMTFTPLLDWMIAKKPGTTNLRAMLIYKREEVTLEKVVENGEFDLLFDLLPQLFITLEHSAWVCDFQHNDLHLGNIMVSRMNTQVDTFIMDRPKNDPLYIRANAGTFVRLIDLGRSYVLQFPYAGDEDGVHTVYDLEEFGIGRRNPSFDTRVFTLRLLESIQRYYRKRVFYDWYTNEPEKFDNFLDLCDELLCVPQLREDPSATGNFVALYRKKYGDDEIELAQERFEEFIEKGTITILRYMTMFEFFLLQYGYTQNAYVPDWDAILSNPLFTYLDDMGETSYYLSTLTKIE